MPTRQADRLGPVFLERPRFGQNLLMNSRRRDPRLGYYPAYTARWSRIRFTVTRLNAAP